jgi:hypothetical protein
MERLLEKLRANGDQIVTDILLWFGIKLDLKLLNETGYIDFPHIHSLVFETGNGIKDVALKEVEIHNYHLSSGVPKSNLGIIPSF